MLLAANIGHPSASGSGLYAGPRLVRTLFNNGTSGASQMLVDDVPCVMKAPPVVVLAPAACNVCMER